MRVDFFMSSVQHYHGDFSLWGMESNSRVLFCVRKRFGDIATYIKDHLMGEMTVRMCEMKNEKKNT